MDSRKIWTRRAITCVLGLALVSLSGAALAADAGDYAPQNIERTYRHLDDAQQLPLPGDTPDRLHNGIPAGACSRMPRHRKQPIGHRQGNRI